MSTKNKSKAMKFLEDVVGDVLTIGNLLQSIRQGEELSQEQFAKKLDISKSHLSDIENGRKTVAPERAVKFAKALGYSQKQFVRLSLQHILDESGIDLKVEVA